MSLKYERVKQADLRFWAPVRWVLRLFSSVSLAIVLLAMVALYGALASVPVALMALVASCVVAGVVGVGGGLTLAVLIFNAGRSPVRTGTTNARSTAVIGCALGGLGVAAYSCNRIIAWTQASPWLRQNRASVIYRLPEFEMTELEFYAWWPLKVILALFIINLIVATFRRIEFKFANIGVLSVHAGIIAVALGSLIYSRGKVEGDLLVWRHDLGGRPVQTFYDSTAPAIYFSTPLDSVALAVPGLPRYNDYADAKPRPLDIHLDNTLAFKTVVSESLRATISGFVSYGELVPNWVEAQAEGVEGSDPAQTHPPRPAIRLASGDASQPDGRLTRLLVAGTNSERIWEDEGWAVEYLHAPPPERLADLMSEFDGPHGLVVDLPGAGFHAVYAITPGQTLKLGQTGYSLQIEDIGPYDMPFATPGYERATDTRAQVQIIRPDAEAPVMRRLVMHRYPERSQDFVKAKDDPIGGPMGRRSPPDPAIRLTYIDATKLQVRLIGEPRGDDAARDESLAAGLRILIRIPGHAPFLGPLPEARFPLGTFQGKDRWLHISERMKNAVQIFEPKITPLKDRRPKEEGTYIHALVPLDLDASTTGSDGQAHAWHKRIWLAHMRYPDVPDETHRPVEVNVPGVGPLSIAFGRQKLTLPFSVDLQDFEMQSYPGTELPRDFISTLKIIDLAGILTFDNPVREAHVVDGQARLNNPLIYRGIKLSQAGWDPGDRADAARDTRGSDGRFTHKHRFAILGVSNNEGIHLIFFGACLIVAGIPWAFYIKPLLVRRAIRRTQAAAPMPVETP